MTKPLQKDVLNSQQSKSIYKPGKNVWRIERADRFAMLVDGGEYFGAAREAMLKAERSIQIMGWDIHSKTPLVGETGKADDGLPNELAPFLTALVERKPDLHIYLLLWDFAVLYAGEREWLPQFRLDWNTPERIHFSLDSAVPLGGSQHQKIITIDDSLAFSGGLDLTIRRWDTRQHRLDDKHRVDPSGEPYPPFHDVQAVVDGPAALALREIFCDRWKLVTGEECEAVVKTASDPWPASVKPQFRRVKVGISRTRPNYGAQKSVREIEQLFIDSIDAAEKFIYIENQFLTSQPIARKICEALNRNPELEAVFVTPHKPESWIEQNTMLYGRIQFAKTFEESGVLDRIRMLCLSVDEEGKCVYPMIHSKVTIIDDKFLRIGSANLNNRSMGTDTECDLSVEADGPEVAQQIALARNTLIAEHCRCNAEEFAAALEREGSLIKAIEHFQGADGCLQKLDDTADDASEEARYLAALADPERPIAEQALQEFMDLEKPKKEYRLWGQIGGAVLILGLLIWLAVSFGDYISSDTVTSYIKSAANSSWAPFAVVGAFIVASSIIFPINALIIAVAAAFGPWLGFIYSLIGVMLGSLTTYGLGQILGRKTAKKLLGARLDKVREKIVRHGIVSVATIRLVPVAPFAVVNFAAGAARIKPLDYAVGTFLGVLPGVVLLSFLGKQAMDVITTPSLQNVALLAAGIAGWIALIVGAQYFAGGIKK